MMIAILSTAILLSLPDGTSVCSVTPPYATPWRYLHGARDCSALAQDQAAVLRALPAPSRITAAKAKGVKTIFSVNREPLKKNAAAIVE